MTEQLHPSHFENIANYQACLSGQQKLYHVHVGEHQYASQYFPENEDSYRRLADHQRLIALKAECQPEQVSMEPIENDEIVKMMMCYIGWITKGEYFVY